MHELKLRNHVIKTEELRIELYGQDQRTRYRCGKGLGGLTTVLDVKINMYPTHAASKPVAMIPNCAAATSRTSFSMVLACYMEPPSLSNWPDVHWVADTEKIKRYRPQYLDEGRSRFLKPGQTLLNGKMLTGRDAAIINAFKIFGERRTLPADFTNRVIYYVGPKLIQYVMKRLAQAPTTATLGTSSPHMMLEKTGLISMIGKSRAHVQLRSNRSKEAQVRISNGGWRCSLPRFQSD